MANFTIGTGAGGVGSMVLTLTGAVTFTNGTGGTIESLVLTNSYAPLYEQLITLSVGANTITVPALAGGVIIIPPTANTQAITLKGVGGDTGILLSKLAPTVLTFDTTPPANFVLNAAGTITACKFVWL